MTNSSIIPASKMGFGCMRLPLLDPDDPKSIDLEQFKAMVDVFMEAGNTYFDTAFIYHEGESETAVGEALVKRYPREAFTVATKCLAWALPDAEAAKNCLEVSLKRMGLDYVDYYLLHNVGGKRTAKFDEYGMWEWAQEQKAAGKIKYVGFSIHDNAATMDALLTEHPEMDFVQVQVNYLDWDDPHNEAANMMAVAAKHNKPAIIMEPARGGRLCNLPEIAQAPLRAVNPNATDANWAYRFCWNLPNVMSVLSGMSTLEQVKENTEAYLNNKPLTAEEKEAIAQAVAALRSLTVVNCTSCNYCIKGCPSGVLIPKIMELINFNAMTNDQDLVKFLYSWQAAEGRASTCIKCGLCESMCPQGIDIIHQLEVATELFED